MDGGAASGGLAHGFQFLPGGGHGGLYRGDLAEPALFPGLGEPAGQAGADLFKTRLLVGVDPEEGASDTSFMRPWGPVVAGRDAIGKYRIRPSSDPVTVTFALGAKLYDPAGSGVGVTDLSRLISRLRHRQFGVLVTTSYVARQAYQEIRADQHAVVSSATPRLDGPSAAGAKSSATTGNHRR